MKKSKSAKTTEHLEQIPGVGPSLANDLRLIGVRHPTELKDQDPFELYQKLCKKTGTRHDPCVLDVFMAAVHFMQGKKTKDWWEFTPIRKRKYPDI